MNGEPRIKGIEYAEGFRDTQNFGISVIGTYDYAADLYRAFLEPDFKEFERLTAKRKVVGFNSILFDDAVCAAEGLRIKSAYDILRETYRAMGLDPFPTEHDGAYQGCGLDALCQANGLGGKTGHGALAPVLWQQGKRQEVIDYCLNDVDLTKKLFDLIRNHGVIRNPKNGGKIVFPPIN